VSLHGFAVPLLRSNRSSIAGALKPEKVREAMNGKPLENPIPNSFVADVLKRCEASYQDYSAKAADSERLGNLGIYEYYKGKAHGFMVAGDLLFEAGVRWRHPL
jgi:hypothetical protein